MILIQIPMFILSIEKTLLFPFVSFFLFTSLRIAVWPKNTFFLDYFLLCFTATLTLGLGNTDIKDIILFIIYKIIIK